MRLSHIRNNWKTVSIGALIFLVAIWAFGDIAEGVLNDEPLVIMDTQLAVWFHAHTTLELTRAMRVVSYLHGVLGISLGAILFAAFLIFKSDWFWLKFLVLVVPCGMLLNVLIKEVVGRARPSFRDPILVLDTYSFPSGHTTGATLFYGVLAAFLVSRIQWWPARAGVVLVALAIVILVAFSRLYLGVHYLSDVLAAFAGSVAWLAICFTALRTLRIR
jgi:membrane-associated phospholipid phosphatase